MYSNKGCIRLSHQDAATCLPGGMYWFDGAGAGSAAGAGAGADAVGGRYWRKCETSAAATATKANKIRNFFETKR